MGEGRIVATFEAFGCRYHGQPAPLLAGVDLTLRAGELVAVIGPSGSGKSSLALALCGVLQHVLRAETEGRVTVDGVDVAEQRVEELATRVGVVFQDPESQLVSLYVADEVAFGPENLALPRQEIVRRVEESLAFVGLAGFDRRFVYELSGGEKQKLALASVLAMRPRLLVFDEPTANMDPASSVEMWTLIRRLRDEGMAVLVIEKELDDLAPLADRLAVLDGGHIRFEGPPRGLLAEHGAYLRDGLGVWIPQVCECELELRERGLSSPELPLTVEEAATAYRGYGEAAAGAVEETKAPPPEKGEPIVVVEHLQFAYPDGTQALRDVSLRLAPDEILAIVGHNGSGKTTLVKQIVGLLRPEAGEVTVFGRRAEGKRLHRLWKDVGFVFQFPEHQFVRDTVGDELGFSLQVAGTPPDEIEARVVEMLQRLDLVGLEARHPFTLSGGEKRRLSVATVLIAQPRLLILDEPTYAQDRRSTLQLMREVSRLVASGGGASAILVTHDMRLVGDFAHRAVVMSAGRPIFDGPVGDLFAAPDVLRTARLGQPPVFRLVEELRRAGLRLPNVASVSDLTRSLAGRAGAPA